MTKLEQIRANPERWKNLLDRYWPKVDVRSSAECWPWKAKAKHPFGYGRMTAGRGVQLKAHQIAYRIQSGRPIPKGFHILHDCDNPSCCNPWHLHMGFARHNSREAIERGRASKPPIRYGEDHHKTKFDRATALKIKADRRSARIVAAEHGICQKTVYRIRHGETWA